LGINKVGGERIDSHIRTIALHNEQGSLAVLARLNKMNLKGSVKRAHLFQEPVSAP
jgi:hypothetical protein